MFQCTIVKNERREKDQKNEREQQKEERERQRGKKVTKRDDKERQIIDVIVHELMCQCDMATSHKGEWKEIERRVKKRQREKTHKEEWEREKISRKEGEGERETNRREKRVIEK